MNMCQKINLIANATKVNTYAKSIQHLLLIQIQVEKWGFSSRYIPSFGGNYKLNLNMKC
jgi:hypothetical protein